MKEAMHGSNVSSAPAPRRQAGRPRRIIRNCSICTKRIPYDAVAVTEPEAVEEPRQSWVLCQDCYQALVQEMHRSPVRTPLRLRIAVGLIAAERRPLPARQPTGLPARLLHDHRVIVSIAWVLIIGMLLHLALIVMLAYIAK